ncbi:Crp/Fnr family transcriptional regulator, partial [Pseudomonadota bacterium]
MATTRSDSKTKIRDLISGVAMFRTTSTEELDTIEEASRIINVTKGDALFHQGEPCKGFYMVLSGSVRLVFTSPDGREHNAMIATIGDHFAEAVMFLGAAYPLDAFAISDAELLFIGKQAVDACLESNPGFARILIANLSAQLHHFASQIAILTLHNATQRVIGYLLTHMKVETKVIHDASFTLPASKHDIASHLNISPETLSRTFRQLDELGLMTVEGR